MLKAGKDGSYSLCISPGSRRQPCGQSGGPPAAERCGWTCSTPLLDRAGNSQECISTIIWPQTDSEDGCSLTGAGEEVPAAQQVTAGGSHQVLGTAQTAKTQIPVRGGGREGLLFKMHPPSNQFLTLCTLGAANGPNTWKV